MVWLTAELPEPRPKAKRLLRQPVASTSANTTRWIPHGGEQYAVVPGPSGLGEHGVLVGSLGKGKIYFL
jgi:hypothetical protein